MKWCKQPRTEVGEWQPLRAEEESPTVGREQMESNVLEVKEAEVFRNEFS